MNEAVTTAIAVTLIVLPWILGGLHPTRGDLAWAILLAFAAGFLSIGATVISAFDVVRLEAATRSPASGEATPTTRASPESGHVE